MEIATNLGFPRIGARREMKKSLESFWAGKINEQDLIKQAHDIKTANWELQYQYGLSHIPSNDFSLYDHVLDMAVLVGAAPAGLDAYFTMARGKQEKKAMEMTKWFDTNYHYIVPELNPGQAFSLNGTKPID